MKNASNWEQIYKDIVSEFGNEQEYYKYKINSKKEFIKLIEKYTEPNSKILEAGCGTGLISGYLTNKGYNVTAIDINEQMIELSNKLLSTLNINKPEYINQSILDLKYEKNSFSTTYSYGVLEHFSDNEIKSIISKELEISKFCIIGVPTTFFEGNAMHGDERYLSKNKWKSLINELGGRIIETQNVFNYHYWRKYLNIKTLFNFKQFYLFVVVKN